LSNPIIRLIDTTKTPVDGPYATLSYCWGTGVTVKLLSSLVDQFLQDIPESTLPKTLNEAIVTTRELDIRFIWIDALCIIQDSLVDWNHEASRMADIYSNSCCNIAAGHNRSCDDGLFLKRDLEQQGTLFVDVQWDEVKCYQLGLIDQNFWINKVDKAPLNKRGWVLQERFLSPRTVHFVHGQLFWECYSKEACESLPKGMVVDSNVGFKKRRFIPRLGVPEYQFSPRLEPYMLWERLLQVYSLTKLSKPTDKLVAISGLAKRIQSEIKDEYIAGLWRNRLSTGLLWFLNSAAVRPIEYRGPSWTWASIDGNISTSRFEGVIVRLVELIGHDITYTTDDKYGQIKSASIHLSGKLYPHGVYRVGLTWAVFFPDESLKSKEFSRPAKLDLQDQDYAEAECYCLPVLYEKSKSVLGCLILQSTGRMQGEYSRIGVFFTRNEVDVNVMFHNSALYEPNPVLYDAALTFTII